MARKGTFVTVKFEMGKKADPEAFLKKLDGFAKTGKAKVSVLGGMGGEAAVHTPNKELEILLNLGDTDSLEIPDYAPIEYTQTGLADAIGLDVSVVSRYLKNLRQRKLVTARTMNIIGDRRRRRVYFLTKKGKDLLGMMFEE